MSEVFAGGIGLATFNQQGDTLDCLFPNPVIQPTGESAQLLKQLPQGTSTLTAEQLSKLDPSGTLAPKALLETDRPLVSVRLDEDSKITSNAEAYLKLHLLSHRLALPNSLNLEDIFAHLPNLAWTNKGPMDLGELNDNLIRARSRG